MNRWLVISLHKGPVIWKSSPCRDIILKKSFPNIEFVVMMLSCFPLPVWSTIKLGASLLLHKHKTNLVQSLSLVLLHWHDSDESISVNGNTAFKWKLCCHWLKDLQLYLIDEWNIAVNLNYKEIFYNSYRINRHDKKGSSFCNIWNEILYTYLSINFLLSAVRYDLRFYTTSCGCLDWLQFIF